MSLRKLPFAVVACVLVVGVGCEKKPVGGPGAGTPEGEVAATPEGGAAPAGAAVIQPGEGANTGVISGTVKLDGDVPAPEPVIMTAKPECVALHKDSPRLGDSLLVGADKGLKDCFVWVSGGLESYKFEPPSGPAVIDQVGCMYEPHVFAVRVNQDITVKSSDAFAHNVNVKENRPFNIAFQGAEEKVKAKWFKKEQVPVKFQCEIHPWMSAYACVVNHPYHAITGADGTFEIKGLPAGKYKVSVWHEAYPGLMAPSPKEVEVEVKEGETATQDFTFTFSG